MLSWTAQLVTISCWMHLLVAAQLYSQPSARAAGAGMEIDPSYVDTAIRRWQNHTRDRASHAVTVAFLMKSKQKGNSMMATDDYDKEATSKPHGYEIGFAKPPSAPRFPKGQSGNPAGRPRGSKNLSTILEQELEERVVIRENGKQRTVTKRRASMKQFVNKA